MAAAGGPPPINASQWANLQHFQTWLSRSRAGSGLMGYVQANFRDIVELLEHADDLILKQHLTDLGAMEEIAEGGELPDPDTAERLAKIPPAQVGVTFLGANQIEEDRLLYENHYRDWQQEVNTKLSAVHPGVRDRLKLNMEKFAASKLRAESFRTKPGDANDWKFYTDYNA